MSEAKQKKIEELRQEQNRLEELLFLLDPSRRPRVHKMLAQLRAEIVATESAPEPHKSMTQLRQWQDQLEDRLFKEPPERRGRIKQMLSKVRAEIAAALVPSSARSDNASSPQANSDEGKMSTPTSSHATPDDPTQAA